MPDLRRISVTGRGVSDSATGVEEALDRPYRYRGPDSEPDPADIAAAVRAEVLRRCPDLAEKEAAPS